jgi:hypothetical protein
VILPLLLAVQAAPVVPPADTADEIVVIGQKLKSWRASIRFRKSGPDCRIRQSTGDAAIDRIGCTAMEQCWPQFLPGFEATRAKGVTADVRKTQTAQLNQALGECVMAKRTAMIADLAEQRAAARRGA